MWFTGRRISVLNISHAILVPPILRPAMGLEFRRYALDVGRRWAGRLGVSVRSDLVVPR